MECASPQIGKPDFKPGCGATDLLGCRDWFSQERAINWAATDLDNFVTHENVGLRGLGDRKRCPPSLNQGAAAFLN